MNPPFMPAAQRFASSSTEDVLQRADALRALERRYAATLARWIAPVRPPKGCPPDVYWEFAAELTERQACETAIAGTSEMAAELELLAYDRVLGVAG